MIELPTATDSVTNKPSSKKSSLYHTCRSVLNALGSVKGFETFLDIEKSSNTFTNTNDPLTRLWHICRQGTSLCYLYNTLRPDTPIATPTKTQTAANKSKACVYHFIIACRDQLNFTEDTLFTVTELYQNDTNGFVKVVNTVKRILDLLEEKGIISVTSIDIGEMNKPKDMRGNVVFELLLTERKYVQDLEALQHYMREVQAQDVLSQDTMHYLFGNLNALVDFQRRFLIQLEGQAANDQKEQRFGNLFLQCEEAFSVYEPFCANFQIAQDLVIHVAPKLQKLAHIMSPTYELPSMLIKPIQRVCKYPLLIQQLVKATPENWPYFYEDKSGMDAIQRVTKKVNETKRLQENLLLVEDFKKRIQMEENWKGSIENFGPLLLHDRFILLRHDNTERDVVVYLFQKACFVCKEIKDNGKKQNAISIKKKRKDGTLILREQIIISRIEHVKGTGQNGQYTLLVTSLMPDTKKTIQLKCRNDEQLRQWLSNIVELTESKIEGGDTTKLEGFPLTPQTPRFSHHHHHSIDDDSIYNYDQDEEDFVGSLSENHSEDEEYTAPAVTPKSYLRTRRFSYQQHPRHADHPARKSLPHAGLLGNILSLPTSRHFNGTPGMTLPPLPRSPSNVSNLMNASIPTIQTHDNYTPVTYPSSPPSSYPSSPTTATTPSSHRNSASIPSGSLWQRRQGSEPKEKINAYNHPHHQSSHIPITPPPTRHQEHLTIPTPPPPPPPLNHVRARSQSSPNIQRPVLKGGHTCELTKINYEKRKSNGYRFEDRMMLPSQPLPGEITKLKVHYFGAIYIVIVPSDIQFDELVKRIGSKIKVFEAVLGLKYEDEEGDLITINSNEDIQMGFESKGMNNAVNLYVTC